MAWNIPSLTTSIFQSFSWPLSSLGTSMPCTATVTTMTAILSSASELAFANYDASQPHTLLFKPHSYGQQTFAISLYSANG